MSNTIKIVRQITVGGKAFGNNSQSLAQGRLAQLSEPVPATTNDHLVAFALDVSACGVFFVKSDKDLTLETNDGTTPDNTFTLKAGVPYIWTSGDGAGFRDTEGVLVATDITGLYATNAGADVANLEVVALSDPTP